MPLTVEALAIPDIKLIRPPVFGDDRGFFSEVFNARDLAREGLYNGFVQDNHSRSRLAGTVRGLHFQLPPHAQDKLVRVTRGRILDVAVDLRPDSPTYLRHVAVELSAEAWNQLYVPRGFAHGFCTLEEDTDVVYKVSAHYAPAYDRGVHWLDPQIGIRWPVAPEDAVLSDKDLRNPNVAEIKETLTW